MVVLDREEYIKKAEELLSQHSYKILPADTTTKQENKLITLLNNIKVEGGINEDTYKRTYPHRSRHPKILWVAKNTQGGNPTQTNCLQ